MKDCPAKNDPKTTWPGFCPNVGAAYFFLFLFTLTMCVHVAQGFMYRKLYSVVIFMGALWQVLAYALRIVSINNPTNVGLYSGWFVLILVSSILLP